MRFWEIDFCRGLTAIAMVAFNWLYALGFLGIIAFNASEPFWFWTARAIAGSFIFIAGVSFYLSETRGKNTVKRGFKLLALGILITLATWFFVPREFVVFGALHAIGTSILLAGFFSSFSPRALTIAGAVAIAVGILLSQARFDFAWLLWLGFKPQAFSSLDYQPLLPWFGVFLSGLAFAKKYYAQGKRRFHIAERNNLVCFLGRHSLAVYLLHIPLLFLLLWLAEGDFLQRLKTTARVV